MESSPPNESIPHPPFPNIKYEPKGEVEYGVPPTPSSKNSGPAAPTSKKPQATKSKQQTAKSTPLPATVEVQGYEITIPNLKKNCWRVHVLYSCGHPVPERAARSQAPAGPSSGQRGGLPHGCVGSGVKSEAEAGGENLGLVVEVNKHHLHSCTEKCKVKTTEHVVEGRCGGCAGPGGMHVGG